MVLSEPPEKHPKCSRRRRAKNSVFSLVYASKPQKFSRLLRAKSAHCPLCTAPKSLKKSACGGQIRCIPPCIQALNARISAESQCFWGPHLPRPAGGGLARVLYHHIFSPTACNNWTPSTGHKYLDESILEGSRLDIRQEHFQKIHMSRFLLTRPRGPLHKHCIMIRTYFTWTETPFACGEQ